MTNNGIQLRQMTEHETKRTSWLLLHPRAEGRQIPQIATCYRCGKVRKIENMREVGNDVYRCKDGCNG